MFIFILTSMFLHATRNTFCRTRSLSNATFSFLITWRSSSSKSAAVYKISSKSDDFYRAMLCKRGLCCHAVSVCMSVCPSVTFVDHVKTNKHKFEIFSPSGSDTILVFPHQRGCRYSDGNPPNRGVECKGVWQNDNLFINITLYLRNGYSEMGTCSEAICKHRILFPSIQHLAWLSQGRTQGKQKCGKNSDFWTYALTSASYNSETVEDR